MTGGSLCVWERYCTITLGWLEVSNAGFIVIADAEMDAKEDEEEKKEEDKKNVPATSLERKKRKKKDTRTTAQRQKKKKEKEGNSKTDN